MREYYLRVMSALSYEVVDKILKCIDGCMSEGYTRLHLLLSTPGGSVSQGVSLSNYLRSVPIEIHTHNLGAVDSIGIAVFCAGVYRTCAHQSRFMLHPVTIPILDNQVITNEFLAEKHREIEVDTANIAGIIGNAVHGKTDEIIRLMKQETIFDSSGALSCGLVDEISAMVLPKKISWASIYADGEMKYYMPADDGK